MLEKKELRVILVHGDLPGQQVVFRDQKAAEEDQVK